MNEPEPINPGEAQDLFGTGEERPADKTEETDGILSFHYHHISHGEDSSLEIASINSIHSQIITWFDMGAKKVKQIVIHHNPENMTHSFNVDLTDGKFPVESCPCNKNLVDAYIWANTGHGLEKVSWGNVVDEPVTDDRDQISHLID